MKRRNTNKADWRTGKPRQRHSLRMVNEVRIDSGDMITAKDKLQSLGKVLWVGWTADDFNTNRMTLRQYVRIPRIFKK